MTSSQKSIRTNDIENVGHTARHHTLFEMLGNFSVGDYFRNEVIPWAWELLTSPEWFGMDPEKLYITVYPKDKESKKVWMKAGVAEDHIYQVEDNFWDIGEGPCGPDSEIFYDRGQEFNNVAEDDPENYPGGENERYLEIWNIVFSEYNHKPDGTYEPLPHKNIDTGWGLNGLFPFSNMRRPTLKLTCLCRSLMQRRKCQLASNTAITPTTTFHSRSLRTTRGQLHLPLGMVHCHQTKAAAMLSAG